MSNTFKVQFFQVYKVVAMALFTVFLITNISGFSEGGEVTGFFVVMAIPILTPFLYSLIFSIKNNPNIAILHPLSLGVFLMVCLAINIQLVGLLSALLIVGLVFTFFLTYAMVDNPLNRQEVLNYKVGTNVPPQEMIQQAPEKLEPEIKIEEKIKRKVQEVQSKITFYQMQLDRLEVESKKRRGYLNDVTQRLASGHLTEANMEVSLRLQKTLADSLENYNLLTKFFSEAQALFVKEKKNLEDTLGNLEIIQFLQTDSPLKNVQEIERTMLQMEFERHIKDIETELPILNDKMLADSIDLSQDMKRQLEEAILKLK